ncbi:MAG TPA: TetR/AcrR family transcriptional regulator [Thermoleophilaceae bacterium]|jgi:AcrR family transcriptional regulator
MATTATGTPRRRRTQEERSATTRAALLDATIECLAEYGYANLTTTKVVERAGVSRGAQVHHFPTKAELVSEAVRHLAAKRVEEFLQTMPKLPSSEEKRVSRILDLIWEVHKSPLFDAALELWVASRTDPELRASLAAVEQNVAETVASVGPTLFPDVASRPNFQSDVDATMAAIRGLALMRFVDDPESVDRRWRRTKRRMLEIFADER